MHAVWAIRELVDHIVGHLVDSSETSSSRLYVRSSTKYLSYLTDDAYRDVSSVGMSARLFRESSLDVIWRTQIHLLPLFGLIGLVADIDEHTIDTMDICRPFDDCDIPNFLFYSGRIVNLCLDDSAAGARGRNFFFGDLHLSQPIVLFPKLRILLTEGSSHSGFVLRHIGDMLQTLTLAIPLPVMNILASKLTNLISLELAVVQESRNDQSVEVQKINTLRDILQSAQKLEDFSLRVSSPSSISAPIWEALVQLPLLTTLCVSGAQLDTAPSRTTIRSLRRFEFVTRDIRSATSVLSQCTFDHVESLTILILTGHSLPPAEAAALFSAIVAANPYTTLQELEITAFFQSVGDHEDTDSTSVRIPASVLHPLLSLSSLQRLILVVFWPWEASDEFIDTMARAWPHLEDFHFDPSSKWSTPLAESRCGITLRAIESLARHCPALKFVNVPFDGTLPPPSNVKAEYPASVAQNTALTKIGLGFLATDSAAEIAAFLSRLFPKLEYVETVDISAQWDEVSNLLRTSAGEWEKRFEQLSE
ncbi:hypothetical protein BXZ70DRAFT_488191 [Cristinia sonorae]|uniref:Uncharacterized protein n=1 Tax=Cristinia sonorae TaxID=1940300 RepID=A0A8K0UIX0_9AGAR|nr:hypothetical protein BXZ70DRAFT_488191 [Cristinia sonorae]